MEAAARVTTQSQDRRGDLDLSCNPADAQIWVDGIQRGVCSDFGSARMLVLGQGMHSVEVKKQGFQTFQTYVDPDGIRARLNVALHPNPGRESGAEP